MKKMLIVLLLTIAATFSFAADSVEIVEVIHSEGIVKVDDSLYYVQKL